jgi:hypothetical protein
VYVRTKEKNGNNDVGAESGEFDVRVISKKIDVQPTATTVVAKN